MSPSPKNIEDILDSFRRMVRERIVGSSLLPRAFGVSEETTAEGIVEWARALECSAYIVGVHEKTEQRQWLWAMLRTSAQELADEYTLPESEGAEDLEIQKEDKPPE